jgi:phytanoyl-CoA dioxygenase PhyH
MSFALERDGALICERILSSDAIDQLRLHFDAINSGRAGSRPFDVPKIIMDLIGPSGSLGTLATEQAGQAATPVRVLLFDKTPASNWAVSWHQDRTIAVKQRADVDGYGPWSVKGDVVHVEPPVAILQNMLTLRLFIDDCGADNGPLEIVVGSHRHGRLPETDLGDAVERGGAFAACGRAGDVLVMKMLAVHSSKRAASPSHRRVLHIDYATIDLPAPLEWMLS